MRIINFQKILLSIIVLFTIFSCNSDDYELTPINPIKLPEASEVFRIEAGLFSSFFILDSFLIMTSTTNGNDKKIHVYNKVNLQFITKFGTNGLAPFELPRIQPLTTIQKNSSRILYYDNKVWRFNTINLDRYLIERNEVSCISSNPMDKELISSANLTILNDYEFAGRNPAFASKGMFFIYDTRKKEMKWIKSIPKMSVDIEHERHLHYGVLDANGLKNSILYATKSFDQVLFYDLEGNLKKHVIFSKLKMPKLDPEYSRVSPESPTYATYTYATPDYCFVHRLGSSINDTHKSPQILVFNWDGVLVNAFEAPALRFCYDEEFGYLYTFEYSDEENDIYVTVRKYKIGNYLVTD